MFFFKKCTWDVAASDEKHGESDDAADVFAKLKKFGALRASKFCHF